MYALEKTDFTDNSLVAPRCTTRIVASYIPHEFVDIRSLTSLVESDDFLGCDSCRLERWVGWFCSSDRRCGTIHRQCAELFPGLVARRHSPFLSPRCECLTTWGFTLSMPDVFHQFQRSGSSGDFSKAATLWPNGTWVDPLPGPS